MIQEMFHVPMEIVTPDNLYFEELSKEHPTLPSLGLKLWKLDRTVVRLANRLADRYSSLSMNDLFALALAKVLASSLLTGDRRLRRAANEENLDVHGTIWMFHYLIHEREISRDRAIKSLDIMKENGRRLPWTEAKNSLMNRSS